MHYARGHITVMSLILGIYFKQIISYEKFYFYTAFSVPLPQLSAAFSSVQKS
jgi:hypothetical protein